MEVILAEHMFVVIRTKQSWSTLTKVGTSQRLEKKKRNTTCAPGANWHCQKKDMKLKHLLQCVKCAILHLKFKWDLVTLQQSRITWSPDGDWEFGIAPKNGNMDAVIKSLLECNLGYRYGNGQAENIWGKNQIYVLMYHRNEISVNLM